METVVKRVIYVFVVLFVNTINIGFYISVGYILILGISADHSQNPKNIIYVNDSEPNIGYLLGRIELSARNEIIPEGVDLLVLDSGGGYIQSAINLREQVLKRKIITYVPSGSVCASACTIIYGAGVSRGAGYGAKFGFHSPNIDLTKSNIEKSVVSLSILDARFKYTEIMKEDGLSEDFIKTWINSLDVKVYTSGQLFELGFVDNLIDDEDEIVEEQ